MPAILRVSPASTVALRYGVLAAALSTFIFGLPLWFLHEPKRQRDAAPQDKTGVVPKPKEQWPVPLFVKLLVPDLLFTMGEGAVVALIQLYFILRFFLLPGALGIIFTISGLA